MISLTKLDKVFNKRSKNKIHVINDISLNFPEKGLVVLLGQSGSGKTTLLNVIGGLDKVDKGEIDFYGKKISRYNPGLWDSIRKEDIGFIFQNYYLKNELSVFDNVAFVLKLIGIYEKEAIEERVNYILKQVGMYKFRKKLASQLSGGQQQRVAIARALVKNPKVIIADEPTGNLDSNNTLEVMNIIKTISLNKLVVLVTHEKDLADFYGDRIIEIKDGKVVNDYENQNQEDHNFINDNAIYLKDLNKVSSLKDEKFESEFYADVDDVEPTKVKFIIKNKTLYIDVNSSIHKIKLNDSSLNLQIKDEHYKKKSREELLETTFDLEKLDHKDLNKKSKFNVSFKTSFFIAFKKFLSYGKKGKFMLMLFALSGIFISYSVINNYTILTEDTSKYIDFSESFVSIDKTNKTVEQLIDMYNEIDLLFDNIYFGYESNQSFNLDVNSNQNRISAGSVENYNVIDKSDLVHGRLPENNNEILISRGIYKQNSMGDVDYSSIGIWELENFVGQKIVISNNVKLEIVGITDEYKKTIYTYSNKQIPILVHGNQYQEENVDLEYFLDLYIYGYSPKIYLATDNSNELLNHLKSKGFNAELVVTEAQKLVDQNIKEGIGSSLILSIIFVGAALIVFFFVMRSTMISRIYEIAVNRALGVRKIEVLGAFVAEIILIVTVSTFVGFLGFSYVLYAISNTTLASFISFRVDLISLGIGTLIVYGLNLFVGLLPLMLLLRKTPSEIISTYDM